MARVVSLTILAIFGLTASVPAHEAATKAAGAMVKIRVDSDNGSPDRVAFDGGAAFVHVAGGYEGTHSYNGSYALSDLAITFGDYEMPLRVISRPAQPEVPLRVYRAVYAGCERTDVSAVMDASASGTVTSLVRTTMRAHRLLETAACPAGEKLRLTRKYYELSCALAGLDRSSLVISADAQTRFERLPNKTAADNQMLRQCTGRGIAQPLREAWQSALEAKANRDVSNFASISQELLDHAEDPAWADGFAAVRIDADHIRALQLDQVYDRQILAYRERDSDEALALNRELLGFKADAKYDKAFEDVRITKERLMLDKAAIEAVAPK